MKKIILLLNLIAFTAISQVTPVGGYLPLNSSKSFTAGNSTFSNVIARGTLSVGSTATVSGDVLLGGSTNTNNYNLNLISSGSKDQQINFRRDGSTAWGLGRANTNARFGIAYNASATPTLGSGDFFSITNLGAVGIGTISPTATLDVVGNAKVSSTFSLGSANLTGGNTGTVAVLSDAISHIDNYVISSTIADNSTYYFSHIPFGITTLNSKLKISGNWTIYQYQFEAWCNGTTSSAETCTLNYQVGTTTTTIRSDVTFTVSGANTYTGTLNVNLNDGDLFNSQLITPNFPTNATNVGITMTYWIRRRT